MKNLVGYCWNCAERTKHKVLYCKESPLERGFLAIFTLGFSELLENREYVCECTACGHINDLTRKE